MMMMMGRLLTLLVITIFVMIEAFEPAPPGTNPEKPIPNRQTSDKRLFKNDSVENVINTIVSNIDKDLGVMFSNCFPSTLDTTVLWAELEKEVPEAFVITGDIPAMWFRDSTFQVNPYLRLLNEDAQMKKLILGLINMQAKFLTQYPHGNAFFNPAPGANNEENIWAKNDVVTPAYDKKVVFEAKYELDSLAAFLYLVGGYYSHTGTAEFMKNPLFATALTAVVKTMKGQQKGTFQEKSEFSFTRKTFTQSETQNLYGVGNPVRRCGLIRSSFRPSDDSTIFPYLIPSNAMAVVGLERVAEMLKREGKLMEQANEMRALAIEVREAINTWAIIDHPILNKKVYAFEVDCYGSFTLMDDANTPSLMSLPYLGYLSKTDAVYQNTREYILSDATNPYYVSHGKYPGIGSPHADLEFPWPMSLAMRGLTTDDNTEIAAMLKQLLSTTAGTGLMHESYNVSDPTIFTRPWFAWANTVFGDLILDVYENPQKRHLLGYASPTGDAMVLVRSSVFVAAMVVIASLVH